MTKAIPLLFFIASLIFSGVSHGADTPPDENGQKLKTLFETFLKDQKELSDKSGGAQFQYDGDILIEPAGSYYAVTLPHIKVNYPDGSHVDIGMISINASAHDTPGQWKMAVAIPTPILLTGADGKPPIKIIIGAQKAAGIWDESLEGFAKLDALYSNIAVNQTDAPYTFSIPETRIVYDYNKNADGTWSGPGFFSMLNTAAQWKENSSSLKFGELRGEIGLERYNPAAVAEYRKQIVSANSAATPASRSQVLDQLSKLLISLGGGIKSGFTVKDLELARPDPATTAPETLTLKSAYVEINADNFAQEKASLGIHFGFEDLKTNPVPKGYEGVLPQTMNMDFKLADMPLKGLVELGKNTLEAVAKNPEMTQLAGMSFMMKTPAILSAAGTGLEIKDSFIGNTEYRFDLNGAAKADINAINFATGSFRGEFSGLDELINRVNAIANEPGHPMAPRAAMLGQTLKSMKTSGVVKPGTESSPVYLYNLVLDAKGQVLLNDKPFFEVPGAPATTPATNPSP